MLWGGVGEIMGAREVFYLVYQLTVFNYTNKLTNLGVYKFISMFDVYIIKKELYRITKFWLFLI